MLEQAADKAIEGVGRRATGLRPGFLVPAVSGAAASRGLDCRSWGKVGKSGGELEEIAPGTRGPPVALV